MTTLNKEILDNLINRLEMEEGYKRFPYKDTVGKLTIGHGRNLDDVGISLAEAEHLLMNDINDAESFLISYVPFYKTLDDVRKSVLIDMCFNMGIHTLLQFKGFLSALSKKDYADASHHMLDSLWARQVGARAKRLAKIMESGNVSE